MLHASTYTVREFSLADMSRGFWAWCIPDISVLLSSGTGI
jgi:hypothetical protein